ncbi:MAG: rhodanese-like domain-containing protein [Sphingobacteriales bacterium]
MMDINAVELLERLQSEAAINVLDVREPIEYHTWNIGGLNIPVSGLEQKLDDLDWNKDDEIIVVCRAGIRSATAKSILELNGYKNIRNLCGGLMALQKIQS